jgi:hypothetical protein
MFVLVMAFPALLLVSVFAEGHDAAEEDLEVLSQSGDGYLVDGSIFTDQGYGAYAWGDFSNGAIPLGAMCSIDWAPWHYARCDAVAALRELDAAFTAEFHNHTHIGITDAYRSFSQQVDTKETRGSLAAEPGQSNHGWGLAFDFGTGIDSYDSAEYAWMKAHGSSFGFFHPTWAERGGPKEEPWHWQFLPDAIRTGTANSPSDLRALGQRMAADRDATTPAGNLPGFTNNSITGDQWTCLDNLWTEVSGWDHLAHNEANDEFGIPQANIYVHGLSDTDYMTNPATQIEWGMTYIGGRYGSACGAWNNYQEFGWY